MELLMVLTVVGILAAVAVPAYRHHLRRVNRTEAITALYEVLAAQERFHLRQGRYSANLTTAPPAGLGMRAHGIGGRYALSIELATDAQTYIARAVPMRGGGQDDDECGEFSLDHRGHRAVSGPRGVAYCWR